MQKKLTVLFAFAIFVLVVGMQTDGYACHKGGNDPKGCGDPPSDDGGANIRVKVDFRDASGDGLMSDDGRIYEDKVDKVSIGIGSTVQGKGNFAMHTSKFAIRKLLLDFSDDNGNGEPDNCVSGVGTCFPPSLPDDLTPGPANLYTSGVNLREMGVGISGASDTLNMSVGIDLNSIDQGTWTLFFYDPYFAGCMGSRPLSVTRQPLSTENPVDTWVIETGENAYACLAENVGAADYAFRGLYHMPFQMIVQKK